ncbi:hypothetical protein STEG23_004832 [Scotinomys teguina]
MVKYLSSMYKALGSVYTPTISELVKDPGEKSPPLIMLLLLFVVLIPQLLQILVMVSGLCNAFCLPLTNTYWSAGIELGAWLTLAKALTPSNTLVFSDTSTLSSIAFTSVSLAKETGVLSPVKSFRMKTVHTDRASFARKQARGAGSGPNRQSPRWRRRLGDARAEKAFHVAPDLSTWLQMGADQYFHFTGVKGPQEEYKREGNEDIRYLPLE